MDRKNEIGKAGEVPRVSVPDCPTRRRLDRAFYRLQDIELVRNQVQDPCFEKHTEQWIIWRELIELELQDVDEQIARISASAGKRPH